MKREKFQMAPRSVNIVSLIELQIPRGGDSLKVGVEGTWFWVKF